MQIFFRSKEDSGIPNYSLPNLANSFCMRDFCRYIGIFWYLPLYRVGRAREVLKLETENKTPEGVILKIRRFFLWAGLFFIITLALLSVYGAFIGSIRAKTFFNSMPLAVYWSVFTILLVVSFYVFPRFRRQPGLLLMHLGGVLIIVGSMFSSQGGHEFQRKYFNRDRVAKGQMIIYEGHAEDRIFIDPNSNPGKSSVHELPFHIRLNVFLITYYDTGNLTVWAGEDAIWSGLATEGCEIKLPGDYGTIIPLQSFNSFQISEKGVAIDVESRQANPALQVLVKRPDGIEQKHYVFEYYGPVSKEEGFDMSYRRVISDYISELEIIKDGKVVLRKNIEVNDPLYYGGYYFYQSSYRTPHQDFPWATVLSVTSDSGLYCVFAGFFALCAGVIYHLWILPVTKSKRMNNNLPEGL